MLFDNANNLIDETLFSPATRMVLKAMRVYGIMPVRFGNSMSIMSEATSTGYLDLTTEQVSELIGKPADPRYSSWLQLLQTVAEELSTIPIATSQSVLAIDVGTTELNIGISNFDVVVGSIGQADIGESFIKNYDYEGSISVILILLAAIVFLPGCIIFGIYLINSD